MNLLQTILYIYNENYYLCSHFLLATGRHQKYMKDTIVLTDTFLQYSQCSFFMNSWLHFVTSGAQLSAGQTSCSMHRDVMYHLTHTARMNHIVNAHCNYSKHVSPKCISGVQC